MADCLALLNPVLPDLARLVEAWPKLPAAVKRAILALVEAVLTKGASDE